MWKLKQAKKPQNIFGGLFGGGGGAASMLGGGGGKLPGMPF